MLTEISGGRSHAGVEILFLKCDSKIQKSIEYNFHHNITHLLKVSVQSFTKEEEILITLCMSYHAKFFYWRLSFSFTFIHHELTYLSTSMFLYINYRILFSKPSPKNSSYQI